MIRVKLASEKTSIYAWHDINTVYVICALLSALIFVFAIIGINTAASISDYQRYVWLPILLLLFSGSILTSSLFRLARRGYLALQDRYDW
ncbi:MAG: hypothetical protein SWH61_02165 [Thermodesulfobacteriota bacterium]|nr:hypothetical protein [Thermodesulfobacteriota bacterium]